MKSGYWIAVLLALAPTLGDLVEQAKRLHREAGLSGDELASFVLRTLTEEIAGRLNGGGELDLDACQHMVDNAFAIFVDGLLTHDTTAGDRYASMLERGVVPAVVALRTDAKLAVVLAPLGPAMPPWLQEQMESEST